MTGTSRPAGGVGRTAAAPARLAGILAILAAIGALLLAVDGIQYQTRLGPSAGLEGFVPLMRFLGAIVLGLLASGLAWCATRPSKGRSIPSVLLPAFVAFAVLILASWIATIPSEEVAPSAPGYAHNLAALNEAVLGVPPASARLLGLFAGVAAGAAAWAWLRLASK